MRRIAAIILALALLVPSVAGAAPTARDRFQKAVAKQSVSNEDLLNGKWKGLCVCRANNQAGAVVHYSATPTDPIHATCMLIGFDAPTGAIESATECPDFVPLVK